MIGLVLFIYTIILIILFGYSLHSFVLIYYYLKFKFKKKIDNNKKILDSFPNVTIQLPIYNEKYVVQRLLKSILRMDYPKEKMEIQILDDSDDETIVIAANLAKQYRQEGYDIKHLRRGSRKEFKAGALQYGLVRAKGEYTAIFDADFVPPPDFLKKLLPEFALTEVAGVQARWGHLNPDESLLTKSQAISLDNHFVIEQQLRTQANCFINFNGTCGIWRKSAILDAGGWQGDTLAEDLDLSYRVQLRGWKIKYRVDYIVPGELPQTVDSFRIQQNRWAKGTCQVACKLLPEVLKSNLKPVAKYEAFVHLTCHINFLVMLLLAIFSLPIVYLKVEKIVPDAYYIFASFFTIGAFGYPLLYYISQRESYSDYKQKIPYIIGVIAYSMGLSVSNAKAVIDVLLKKKNNFTRTPKSGGAKQTYRLETKSFIPFIEVMLGLYVFISLLYVIINFQLVLIPFLFFYSFGFLSMGLSSIKEGILSVKPQEVLCSRENS